MNEILYHYAPTANPQGYQIDGVPLSDLTKRQWARLSKPLQEAVKSSPFYRKAIAADAAAPTESEPEAAAPVARNKKGK